MQQLHEFGAVAARLGCRLFPILLGPLRGAQQTDDGVLALGPPLRGTLSHIAPDIHTQGQVLSKQCACGTKHHPDQRQ